MEASNWLPYFLTAGKNLARIPSGGRRAADESLSSISASSRSSRARRIMYALAHRYTVTEQPLQDGSIKLTIQVGGAAP